MRILASFETQVKSHSSSLYIRFSTVPLSFTSLSCAFTSALQFSWRVWQTTIGTYLHCTLPSYMGRSFKYSVHAWMLMLHFPQCMFLYMHLVWHLSSVCIANSFSTISWNGAPWVVIVEMDRFKEFNILICNTLSWKLKCLHILKKMFNLDSIFILIVEDGRRGL